MRGSWSATRRGVKPRLTSSRRFLCSGSSMLIMDGIGGESGRCPPPLHIASGVFEAVWMSEWRVTPHTPFFSS